MDRKDKLMIKLKVVPIGKEYINPQVASRKSQINQAKEIEDKAMVGVEVTLDERKFSTNLNSKK